MRHLGFRSSIFFEESVNILNKGFVFKRMLENLNERTVA